MNKTLRITLPIILAGMLLGSIFYLMGTSHHALASGDSISKSWVGRERIKKPSETQSMIPVTTLEDELNSDGDCSLREAITAANDNVPWDACPAGEVDNIDTITFNVSGTIMLSDSLGHLSVMPAGPLVIDGGNVITVSGGGATRVWWMEYGSIVTLKHMSVIDGFATDGAGLYNGGGNVTIDDCILSGNIADQLGGGGIYNSFGTLVLSHSTLSGNFGSDFGGGGIYNDNATLVVTHSFLYGNSADTGGAIRINGEGTITVTQSTLSGNVAREGGAIWNMGTLLVTNSTLSDNHSDQGGAAIHNWFFSVVSNSTLSGNSSDFGAAISNSYNPLTVTNSIIANYPFGIDCTIPISDGGHNISSDGTCGLLTTNGSLPNTDPMLAPLQDNGGSTWTQALLEYSPAIDAGDNAHCPSTDQRGIPRPQDGDNNGTAVCDIGSYELESLLKSPTQVTIAGSSDGLVVQSYPFTATIEPISTTLPLEYVWQASGQSIVTHTNGLTDAVSFAWEMPGTKAITVTASNMAGSVMDSHLITISDIPISGLVASNDSPTLLGETTTLSATIQAGTNIVYTWDFGDDESGIGQFVNHIYPSLGVYTATVTATNSSNFLTAKTQVIITSTTHQLYLPLVINSTNPPLSPAPASSNSNGVILAGLVTFGFLGKGWVEDGHRLPNNGL